MKLVRLLTKEELCVCELEYILSLTQPAISQQVRVLREAGLATARREGNWIFYRVHEEDLVNALDTVCRFFRSSPGEMSNGMTEEWTRYQEILDEPLENCPRKGGGKGP